MPKTKNASPNYSYIKRSIHEHKNPILLVFTIQIYCRLKLIYSVIFTTGVSDIAMVKLQTPFKHHVSILVLTIIFSSKFWKESKLSYIY